LLGLLKHAGYEEAAQASRHAGHADLIREALDGMRAEPAHHVLLRVQVEERREVRLIPVSQAAGLSRLRSRRQTAMEGR
jgi:hypothetical protein